jgi:outer membrane protein OmpA-like peptidoglycan-associated protein
MLKKITVVLFFALTTLPGFAQKKATKPAPSSDFNTKEAEIALLKVLNKVRTDNKLDSVEYNDILGKAAAIQSADMAKNGKAELDNSKGKYKTTEKRVIASGGTNKTQELVIATSILKGKVSMSAQELAEAAFYKWRVGKIPQSIIKNSDFLFASPSVTLDASGKKAYISIVFGSFNTFNSGADKKKELPVPYSSKSKKLKTPEDRSCNACKKFKDWEGLASGLYVENGKIYIKYASLKALSKFIRKSKDGLAVDIVQRAQYDNPDYNIVDNNLISKGVLLKTVTMSKLYSKNRIKSVKKGSRVIKATKLDVQLGELPKKITGPYELNLLIVQDGKLCKVIMPSKIEQGDQESNTPLSMLLMPDSAAYFKPPFEPKSESTLLNFNVPFEKNKSDYKEADMEPFLTALQEPDFFIEGLYITAYSSIEGDAKLNEKLQKKRAESIVKALSKMQKAGVVTNVKTTDSWNLFQMEAEDGKYDNLTKMTKEKAIQEINSKGLSDELEPILVKERFAQIIMDVTYDITGNKEEKFSVSKFNQAMKKFDIKQCLKIQYYIGKQMRTQKYTGEALSKLNIPFDAKNAGLLNNQVVLRYMYNNNVATEEDLIEMKKLAALDPSNNYITFNNLFCAVKLDSTLGDTKAQNEMQKNIDAMYKTDVPKKYVDALNIEWQFKIIESMDSAENSELVTQACIEKIKTFYNIKESSWQNNLKLAYIFARFKDYKFAASLLAPFIPQQSVNENVLFAYASICAKMPELYKSRTFVMALKKAEEANHDRYCKLFGAPNITFQVFDNPNVKADYKKAACSK